MHDPWLDRLSDALDGELDASELERLEAHLAACAACAAAWSDLTRVRERARTLEDRPPDRDLWPGIEARIGGVSSTVRGLGGRSGGGGAPRRFSFTVPQLVAAGLALALVSGAAALILRWGAVRGGGSREDSPRGAFIAGAGRVADSSGVPSHSEYESAVSDLKRALASGRGKLDPATVRTLEANLAIIELAIDQSRRALAADPANPYVREHLAETMRRKVELLRRATTLASTG